MNPVQTKITTVKASRYLRKLHKRQQFTSLMTTPYLLTWFEVIGYTVALESDISSHEHLLQRNNHTEVILNSQLRDALPRINPTIPTQGILAAIDQIASKKNLCLLENNRRFQQFLTQGIDVTYQIENQTFHNKIWLIDRLNLCQNHWLVIHPFTIINGNFTHSVDIVVSFHFHHYFMSLKPLFEFRQAFQQY